MKKIKENFKKYSTVYIVVLLLLVIIGVSYAIFAVTNLSDVNTINLGQISMSYTEPENALVLENALPMSDEDGKAQSDYFEFKVTTHATTDADDSNGLTIPYEIVIDSLARDEGMSSLSTSDIKVYLTKVVGGVEEEVVAPATLSELSFSTMPLANFIYRTSDTHRNAGSEITTTYRLRAWIDESVDVSKFADSIYQYKFRVNINSNVEAVSNVNNLDSYWKSYIKDLGLFYALYTLDTKDLPESKIYNDVTYTKTEEIDVSELRNNTVIFGVYEDVSGNKIGIIGQDGGVIAPEDSSYLFGMMIASVPSQPEPDDPEGGHIGGTVVSYVETIDLTYLDTSRVTNMTNMFSSGFALKNIIFGEKFDTSNVTDMSSMFNMCGSLTELNLSSFDTSNVTNMQSMFWRSALIDLDLSSFNTSNVTDMRGMFRDCSDLKQVIVGCDWTTENAAVDMMYDNSGVSEVTVVC